MFPVPIQGPVAVGADCSSPPLKVIWTELPDQWLPVINGPTAPPPYEIRGAISEFTTTTPPRLILGESVTSAGWLSSNAQRIPVDAGAASGWFGSHSAPNSSVTPLEPRPGKVSDGLSATLATGEYPGEVHTGVVPPWRTMLSRKLDGNIPYPVAPT